MIRRHRLVAGFLAVAVLALVSALLPVLGPVALAVTAAGSGTAVTVEVLHHAQR